MVFGVEDDRKGIHQEEKLSGERPSEKLRIL